jgi:molybdopterin molybdotransferase
MTTGGPIHGGFERRVADWLSPAQALGRVLASASPLAAESVPLGEALGRALAIDVAATARLPPWDNSAMDGFAVRAEDIRGASPEHPVQLPVIGAVRAGEPPVAPLPATAAIRIMTGAPVPPGADSVVRVEDTDGEAVAGRVVVRSDRDAGRNVRPAGRDMHPGDVVVTKGREVDAGVVAVLAATGATEAPVRARPRVAIVTTGDELRRAAAFADVQAGRGIPETNGVMLEAAVRLAGGLPVLGPIVEDDVAALGRAIDDAVTADALITVGGASMGEADLVKRVLDSRGFSLDFWRVTIRPGSPFGFGHLPRPQGPQPVFSLPGNPSSAFVTFELFVRPWLLRAAGRSSVGRPIVRCIAGAGLDGSPGLWFYMRVRLDAGEAAPVAFPTGPQGSGLVRGLAQADGLAIIPPDPGSLSEGEPVDVMLFHPPQGSGSTGAR